MNLLTVEGFANALSSCLRLQRGAVCWLGVPCSSFVFLSRGHTRRTQTNPLGNVARRDVASANAIAARVAFLLRVMLAAAFSPAGTFRALRVEADAAGRI